MLMKIQLNVKNMPNYTEYIVRTVLKEHYNEGNPEPDAVVDTNVQTGIDPFAPIPGAGEETRTEYKVLKDTIVVTNPHADYYYRLTDKYGNVAYDKNGNPLDWIKGNTATENTIIFTNLDSSTSYYIQIKSDTNPNSDPVKVTTAIKTGNSECGNQRSG